MPKRWLIVNADDLGLSRKTNLGIFQAHEHGIVTSASLMVGQSATEHAVELSRRFPDLSLGLHVDLGEWNYRDGEWRPQREIVPVDDAGAVEAEILRQLGSFRQLAGRDPTHIDSHQHVHREGSLRIVFEKIAQNFGLPLRACDRRVAFCGEFYGRTKTEAFAEGISVASLSRIIHALDNGITELSCHPGLDGGLASDYRDERIQEVRTLCDPAVRAHLEHEHVTLISFARLPLIGT
jgi:chitin disaccharide deacetylase